MDNSSIVEEKRLQLILKIVFIVVPIVAGLDKFTNILTDWSHYLAPKTVAMLPFDAATFMMIVGIVEIVAGFLVLFVTRIGAYIVSLWLVLIALSLLFTWHYPDVAVRDIVMAISAFVLAKLTEITSDHN